MPSTVKKTLDRRYFPIRRQHSPPGDSFCHFAAKTARGKAWTAGRVFTLPSWRHARFPRRRSVGLPEKRDSLPAPEGVGLPAPSTAIHPAIEIGGILTEIFREERGNLPRGNTRILSMPETCRWRCFFLHLEKRRSSWKRCRQREAVFPRPSANGG